MQANVRQRLVGALVLICLSAIFWPVLFSNDVNPSMDKTTRIPVAPKFEKFTVDKPQKPVNVSEVVKYQAEDEAVAEPSESSIVVPASSEAKPKAAKAAETPSKPQNIQKPEFTPSGLPKYWALQLASFSQKAKATKLKQALIAKGYKVDTRLVKTQSGNMVRVYVGPKLDKSILLRAKKVIDKEFKVQSMLVRFSPKQP